MAKSINLLTDAAIRKTAASSKIQRIPDGLGLFLVIQPTGTRSWVFRRKIDGKDVQVGLGGYPDVSLSLARERAAAQRAIVHRGDNPAEEKYEKRDKTFGELAELYLSAKEQHNSEVTNKKRRQILDNHVLIDWRDKPGKEITAVDVGDLLIRAQERSMKKAQESGGRKAGTSIARDKVYGYTKEILDYAAALGHIQSSPVTPAIKLRLAPHVTKHFRKMEIEQLPDFMRAFDEYRGYITVKQMLLFVMLTGCRTGEARDLLWEYVDLGKGIVRIEPEGHKSGKAAINKGRDDAPIHVIPLSKQVRAILERMREETGAYVRVFPKFNEYTAKASENVLTKAIERMGFKGQQDGHGFRSLMRSEMRLRGASRDALELILGHDIGMNDVERAYQRGMELAFLDERRKILQEWADFVDAARRLRDNDWLEFVQAGRK